VNTYLIKNDLLEIGRSQTIGLVVETGCQYFASLGFPHKITVGLRISKMGTSSVRYEIALFSKESVEAAAQGHFVHVYVNEKSRKPISIPTNMRTKLSKLVHQNKDENEKFHE
jgi:acyl-CoA thioester hydrolase